MNQIAELGKELNDIFTTLSKELEKPRPQAVTVIVPQYLSPKGLQSLIGRKATTVSQINKEFKEFLRTHPKHFEPMFKEHQVIIEGQYSVHCYMYFYRNRKLIEIGSSWLPDFKDEYKHIRELIA